MSGFIKTETHNARREFIDYIYGLIRFELYEGEDNEKRLEVLSKIHYDLLYLEELKDTKEWRPSVKGKGELEMALDRLNKANDEIAILKEQLDNALSASIEPKNIEEQLSLL